MDLNQSLEFTATPRPHGHLQHNFMPLHPLALPFYHQTSHEDGEEGRRRRFMQQLQQHLDIFWHQRIFEIQNLSEFKSQHLFPLARIKRIMKADGNVKMISAETPLLFAKACELFILEITLRAWTHTEDNQRRTLQRCDIARALRQEQVFHFLVDSVKEEETGRYGEDQLQSGPPLIQLHPFNMNLNEVSEREKTLIG